MGSASGKVQISGGCVKQELSGCFSDGFLVICPVGSDLVGFASAVGWGVLAAQIRCQVGVTKVDPVCYWIYVIWRNQ